MSQTRSGKFDDVILKNADIAKAKCARIRPKAKCARTRLSTLLYTSKLTTLDSLKKSLSGG